MLYRRHQVSALGLLDISLNNNLNFKLANWQVFAIFSFSFSQGKEEKKPEKPSVMNPKKSYNIGE